MARRDAKRMAIKKEGDKGKKAKQIPAFNKIPARDQRRLQRMEEGGAPTAQLDLYAKAIAKEGRFPHSPGDAMNMLNLGIRGADDYATAIARQSKGNETKLYKALLADYTRRSKR